MAKKILWFQQSVTWTEKPPQHGSTLAAGLFCSDEIFKAISKKDGCSIPSSQECEAHQVNSLCLKYLLCMGKTSQLLCGMFGTDSRKAHCILLYCPSSCRRKVQLRDVNLHVLQKNATTACACYKYAKTTAERSFLILDQKCPFSLGGCSQDPSVTVAKTKLISFFSPDNCHQTGISETYYSLSRRHLEPGLAQTLLFKRKVKKTDSTSK